MDEAIHLYKSALQILKESNYMSLDDSIMEKMRVDLAELLHAAGRYTCLLFFFFFFASRYTCLLHNIVVGNEIFYYAFGHIF